jgi:hypothetical protein
MNYLQLQSLITFKQVTIRLLLKLEICRQNSCDDCFRSSIFVFLSSVIWRNVCVNSVIAKKNSTDNKLRTSNRIVAQSFISSHSQNKASYTLDSMSTSIGRIALGGSAQAVQFKYGADTATLTPRAVSHNLYKTFHSFIRNRIFYRFICYFTICHIF